jgi:hypothetical protein
VEKDWEARFANRPAHRKFNKTGVWAAAGYWWVTIGAFLVIQNSGLDVVGFGGILVWAVTLPSSVLIFAAGPVLRPDPNPPYDSPVLHPLGIFVLFPLICGGLNSVLIYWLVGAIQRRRGRKAQPL